MSKYVSKTNVEKHLAALCEVIRTSAEDPQPVPSEDEIAEPWAEVLSQLEEEFGGEEKSRTLGPGNYFGESALYYGRPNRASVTARSHARLLELSAEDFNGLVKRHPRLKERVGEIAVSVTDDA